MSLDIIVVDDDAIVLFLHKTLIAKTQDSFPVHSFVSAEEALLHVIQHKEENAFLILLDINMPEMNGWQFLEQLQKLQLPQPVFIAMVTSSINTSDREKSLNYPLITSFMEKPLSRTAFRDLLQTVQKELKTP